MDVAKETNEVMDLLIETIKVVRNKGEYTSLVGELVKAVEGADKIGSELADQRVFINTVGSRLGDLLDAFKKSA